MRVVVLFACLAAAACARAQDLALTAGVMQSRVPDARSFAIGITYTQELTPWLDASLAYRNEGHVPGHHRDGHAALLWLKTQVFAPELTLAAGAGPYRYFDTEVAEIGTDYANSHGWGAIYGVTATWRPRASRWFYQLRIEHVETGVNLDTTMVMAGAGYRLEPDATGSPAPDHRERDDEVFVGGGQTIVNSFESENARAALVSYRHAFGRVLRASVGFLHEGEAQLIRRDGVVLQGWLEPSFENDRFTLGIGYGGYFATDHYRSGEKDLLAIIGTTASYRLGSHWLGRFEWQRVASRHSRDSDIVVLGLGYRF